MPGSYQVMASAVGSSLTIRQQIVVHREENTQVVTLNIPAAHASLTGNEYRFVISAGSYLLVVQNEGYQAHTETIDLPKTRFLGSSYRCEYKAVILKHERP